MSPTNKIDHFDLILYPFKTVYGLNNKTEYKNSFKYTAENLEKIKADLALTKNIAHNIVTPEVGKDTEEIACIKNYLKLKARITTTKKVTLIEEDEILKSIYKAIYINFNARQVDFGEEIPYETILAVIKNADYRIKEVNLDEPSLSTKFCLTNGHEEPLSDASNTEKLGNRLYNKLVRRNVLAGKIAAFKYNEDFISEFDKTTYPGEYPVYPEVSTKKITKIESEFDVGTAYAQRNDAEEPHGYVLKENEVIQFRVPNFKTTKTYPAYVNYFIKLNPNTGSEDAIPATFQTLGTFMYNGGSDDKWNDLINLAAIKPYVKEELTIKDNDTFSSALEKHVKLFKLLDMSYAAVSSYDGSVSSYFYLPINDNIFAFLNAWVRTQDSAELKAGIDASTPENEKYKKLAGIYRSTGVQEKPAGRLIDSAKKKYLPAYKFNTVVDNATTLNDFYIQQTYSSDSDEVIKKEVTADGFGKDARYQGVPKNGEYQLKTGEYLLINYTDSKTDDSGSEQKTVINKVYGAGDIIRANFELIDSELYHNQHTYPKRDGFVFSGYQQPEGMFTLSTNEQIEIRDIVNVKLEDDPMYLYWILNSDDPNAESNEFKFDEDYDGGENNAYTLKEGEHLYYTNSKKQDLIDYGAGTLIVKKASTPVLRKYTISNEVSEEDIMTYGLAANIPWQHYSFSKTKGLTVIENQYLSLTEGDIIVKIDDIPPNNITNAWQQVSDPTNTAYRLAEDETDSYLPPVVVDNLFWSVRSRLDFNMSKTTAQPLHRGDKLTITYTDNSTTALTPKATADYATVYVNSNYTCQAATDLLDTALLLENNIELKLKISSQTSPTIASAEKLPLNNYVNGNAKYTKFDFANLPPVIPESDWLKLEENADKTATDYASWKATNEHFAFSLNVSLPDTAFGLVAIYYIKNIDETAATGAYIKAKSGTTEIEGLRIFNDNNEFIAKKDLNAGLNIIEVDPDVKQIEFYSDTAKASTVIFGTLDVITGINPKLDYRITDDIAVPEEERAITPLDQLLKDLRASGVAQDFYYNVPIQPANEIDLNVAIEDDLLSNPLSWYDPNNINRKFVISEIDANYLPTGITLTRASRAGS